METRVVVVGAGMGGLVAAALLAARGCAVVLVERQREPGGKLRRIGLGAVEIDVGPTVLTLKDVFDEVFAACGERLDDALALEPARILARHLWPDGARLDLHADPDESATAVAAFAGDAAGQEWRAFQAHAREAYQILDEAFIRDPSPSLARLMLRVGPARLSRLDPYRSYAEALERAFSDPRLRQLYGRYATYVGASPHDAPATLALIAHVEQRGVWRAPGGLAALPRALAGLAERRGARLMFGEAAAEVRVEGACATGVRLQGGEVLAADAIVFAGDSGALGDGRLGPAVRRAAPRVAPAERSFSAFTLALHARVAGAPLAHHTVLFSPDSAREFAELKAGRIPSDASLYVCAQDRADDGAGADRAGEPRGRERLFVIVNAPPQGDRDRPDAAETEAARAMVARNLARAGVELDWADAEVEVIGPREFEALDPGSGGAIYGRSAKGAFAAFQRPGSRTAVRGLYLAGGTAHPGAGLPMAARSGQAAAACVLEDVADRNVRAAARR